MRKLTLSVFSSCLGDEKMFDLCVTSNSLPEVVPFARYVLRAEDAPILEKALSSDVNGVHGDVSLVDTLAAVTNKSFFDLLSRYLVGGNGLSNIDENLLWQFPYAPRNAPLDRYAAEVGAFLRDHPQAKARWAAKEVLLILQHGNGECHLEREQSYGEPHVCEYLCPRYGSRSAQMPECREFVLAADPTLWNRPPPLRVIATEGPWPFP